MMVEQHIARIVSEELHVEEQQVVPEAHLSHDLAADSLDTVVLILALEDQYHIAIPDEEAKTLHTVSDIVQCVHGKLLNQLKNWRRKPVISDGLCA